MLCGLIHRFLYVCAFFSEPQMHRVFEYMHVLSTLDVNTTTIQHQLLYSKQENEDLVLKSQNHTPQNDETKLITRPFSICNDRVFALRLNHLSHASAYHNIYAHIHTLGWSIQIRELELLDGSSNSNYPKNQSDKIRPSG